MLDASLLRRRISDKREGSVYTVLQELKDNKIVLPEFQREYVWDLTKVQNLLISIISGRIIGNLMVWGTGVRVQSTSLTGNADMESKTGKYEYLLDGQQRMTSLYHAMQGNVILPGKGKKAMDFTKILLDLDAETIEDLIFVKSKETNDKRAIPFCDIFTPEGLKKHGNIITLDDKASLRMIQDRFLDYNITISTLRTDDTNEAIQQFTVLNTGGTNMKDFDILLSKIYSADFQLKREAHKLEEELKEFKLSDKSIVDALVFSLKGEVGKKEILSTELEEVETEWKAFTKALKSAVDYLRSIGFAHFGTLPSKTNFLVVCRLFYAEKLTHLNSIQSQNVQRYIIQTGISDEYKSSTNRVMMIHYQQLSEILNDQNHSSFQLSGLTKDYILKQGKDFKNGKNSFEKSLLWMLVRNRPLSMKNNELIKLDGASTSGRYDQNLHHIYPKDFMKGRTSKYEVDHLVNICHTESGVNQKEISNRHPSDYLVEFASCNPQINEACDSLLIDYQVAIQDDYDRFFETRLEAFMNLIKSHFPELV